MATKKITKRETALALPKDQQLSVENLMKEAIKKDASIDTIERIFTLREKMKSEWAKQQFDGAMAAFQSECPVIKKTKIVKNKDGSVRYRYAPLDSIVLQVKSLLQRHGFSYTLDSQVTENRVTPTCKVTHVAGHSESSSFTIPIDPDAFMTGAQKFASALTFAKRYAFINAFGILTGDEDDDAVSTGDPLEAKRTKYIADCEKKGDVKGLEFARKQIMEDKDATNQEKMKWAGMINEAIKRITKEK